MLSNLSTLYKKEYYYEIEDDTLSSPILILKALSTRDIDLIRHITKKSPQTAKLIAIKKSFKESVNIVGASSVDDVINVLTQEQIDEIYSFILSCSMYTEDIHKATSLSIKLSMEEKFSSETWDCEVCKSKGLDQARNCKFREDLDSIRDPSFQLLVSGEVFTECPMYYKDDYLLSEAIACYTAYDKGILPDEGGLLDQTEFFIATSATIRDYKARLEREAIEKDK